jgi:tetratricopeptide (TPR) repeat protein
MALLNYARTLNDLDRTDEAVQLAERARALAKASGNEVVVDQSLLTLCSLYRKRGELDRADSALDEVEPVLRHQLPAGHIAFSSLSSLRALDAQARGELEKALPLADEAVALTQASIRAGREGGAYVDTYLVRRAELQLARSHPLEAAADAQTVVDHLRGGSSVVLGRAYSVLGRALRAQGRAEEARDPLRKAVENLTATLGPETAETRAASQLL